MSVVSTINERVAEMHAAQAALPSKEVMSAFRREQAELADRGLPAGIAEVGTTLPDATVLDVHGASASLYAVTGQQWAVLVFYRGAWCPYCNIALAAYEADLLPQLQARRVRLVAISPQNPDGSLSMQEKNQLTFNVISDPGNALAGLLGVLTGPSEEARTAQLQLGLDLSEVNADGTVTLPMPTVAIIDPDHVLRWIDVHPDYSTRTEPRQILDALERLRP